MTETSLEEFIESTFSTSRSPNEIGIQFGEEDVHLVCCQLYKTVLIFERQNLRLQVMNTLFLTNKIGLGGLIISQSTGAGRFTLFTIVYDFQIRITQVIIGQVLFQVGHHFIGQWIANDGKMVTSMLRSPCLRTKLVESTLLFSKLKFAVTY